MVVATEDAVRPANAVVRLTLPARPEFVRLARLTAAGLASRLGFTLEDLEDVRIAVDELCYLVVGADGHDGTIELTYECANEALIVEGCGPAPEPQADLTAMSERILAVVADEHRVLRDGPTVRFQIVRRRRDD
jgi:hypothetical protein